MRRLDSAYPHASYLCVRIPEYCTRAQAVLRPHDLQLPTDTQRLQGEAIELKILLMDSSAILAHSLKALQPQLVRLLSCCCLRANGVAASDKGLKAGQGSKSKITVLGRWTGQGLS